MELKDKCAICLIVMNRGPVIKLRPCSHLLHKKCFGYLAPSTNCPICRASIDFFEDIKRKSYRKYSPQDRERIILCADSGGDWIDLAASLNITYKSAYNWLQSGNINAGARGGVKPKILDIEKIGIIMAWIEAECDLTLKTIQTRLLTQFQVTVSTTTIGNTLQNELYTMKNIHKMPINMNSVENKLKRKVFVTALLQFIRDGKQCVWMDETNFNLYCRRSKGRAKKGKRAVQTLPVSKGPNIHLIGAISATGVILMERRRGSFTAALGNEFALKVVAQWTALGHAEEDLVLIGDNAPCHAQIETAIAGTRANFLRLGPYSPQLNPIENVWSKVKAEAKSNIRIPEVIPPGVGAQRVAYLEDAIDRAIAMITPNDCARAVQHSTIFHSDALAMNDMSVGT